MNKVEVKDGYLRFRCPGCEDLHMIPVNQTDGSTTWQWNGSMESPTVTPSIKATSGHYVEGFEHGKKCWCSWKEDEDNPGFNCYLCHSFVTDGKIQFLDDCSHDKKGQTIPLPEYK